MAFVQAKCTNCGGVLTVDEKRMLPFVLIVIHRT